MMKRLRISLARPLAAGLVALLVGCATTQMNAEWRDPAFTAGLLKGARVLVVCRGPDEAVRRVCEDQWSSQLGTKGVAVQTSYSIPGFPWASGDTSDEMRAAGRRSASASAAAAAAVIGAVASASAALGSRCRSAARRRPKAWPRVRRS